MHLKQLGYSVNVTTEKTELVPLVKGAFVPQATSALLKKHKKDFLKWLATCQACGRENGCHEDRERLKGINPFCSEVGCPWRGG